MQEKLTAEERKEIAEKVRRGEKVSLEEELLKKDQKSNRVFAVIQIVLSSVVSVITSLLILDMAGYIDLTDLSKLLSALL